MGSVFLKFLAGAFAGLLTGLITEPSAPMLFADPRWGEWSARTTLILGCLLGGAVGAIEGLPKGGTVWILRSLGIGALFGAIGATFGASLGGGLANSLLGSTWLEISVLPIRMVGRALLFVGMGVFVGAAIGGSSLNVRKLIQGATGGLVGGAVSGLLFDPLGEVLGGTIMTLRGQAPGVVGDTGGPSRMIGWVVLGGMIALMIGLVDRLTRKAWLRADFGRNEFKEWPLDAAQNFVGRGETCHVILRNDPGVAPVHASIAQQGGHFVLSDAGTPAGTFVNGHRVGQVSLNPGDVVGIGGFALRFMVKNMTQTYAPHMTMPASQPPLTQAIPATPYGLPPQSTSQPTVAFAAQPQGPTLVALDGPHAGRRFPLTGPLEIGREAAGIALAGDANASRRHARVEATPGGVGVTDLGSTNGTFVDGARVASALARPGSTIRVGSTTFRVE